MMEEVDQFIILEKGGLWAYQFLQRNPKYASDFTTGKKLNLYHYSPPIKMGLNLSPETLQKRQGHIVNSTTTKFGSLKEEAFQKKGLALLLDCEVETGLTLNFATRFLKQLGYRKEEIHVFAKEGQHAPLTIKPVSHYQERIDKTNEGLQRFLL